MPSLGVLPRAAGRDQQQVADLPSAGAWTIRRASPHDREGLVRLLADSSPATLHHRFLTGMGATPPPRLVDSLLRQDPSARVVLALVGDVVVGHGMCALTSPHAEAACAEVALLVRDDHQRRGVGSALVRALRSACADLGAEWIEVTIAADNVAAVSLLHLQERGLPPQQDGTALTYHLPLRGLSAPPRR